MTRLPQAAAIQGMHRLSAQGRRGWRSALQGSAFRRPRGCACGMLQLAFLFSSSAGSALLVR